MESDIVSLMILINMSIVPVKDQLDNVASPSTSLLNFQAGFPQHTD